MKTNEQQALYDYLVSEYNHPFTWGDWSYLKGRQIHVSSESPAWDYAEAVQTALQTVNSVLDMDTGSGGIFASILQQQPVREVYATEGYEPNLILARQLLGPLGATVYDVKDEHLPFADNALELVINRHGSYDVQEVWRVVKPGHLFITQQVGDQTNLRIHELLGTKKQIYSFDYSHPKSTFNLAYAIEELQAVGWHIIDQKEHFGTTRFLDIGALVYYLKAIPWEVPDFSVEKYFDRLLEIQRVFERDGFVDVTFHSFFIVARKA